ncbi:NAD(P)H-dependent nitrate reductase catalytic subunit [Tissierella praeacuta DSM 18095]|uniref:NAD(P)H-dependent nitrate reductase catalytic subunit n=1 Tax=Tissierella praeacuta DSM 18095 TaxID=1123404 RepID=A0A1M4XNA6_9FIRM|nr:molybdopterin-dependent oxidoreductase [Tissierella praeacuta]SHE94955.1 NAD(P)H-dependent nitrate reductase catalytic subunit [Tissierella praeacuta DSM 18095]SUO99820.1 Nitrate reductase [Tissierella praeacuta]
MKKVQSTCNYCALDCNLDFYVEDNRVVKVVPTKGYPVNNGFSCIKGLSLDKQQTTVNCSPLPKIKQPDGSFKYVSWEEGFEYVANKLLELQEKYGKESVAGISTGQLTMEEFAIFGHVMRNFLKTNVDGNTRLCMATAVVAHKQSFGFDAPGFTLRDIELSDRIILIGANPVVAHPILWERILKNKNKKLIVIDPRRSETAQNADYWYGLKGKTDLVLLYTIANILIEKDYIDKDYIEKSTEGFEEFKSFVKSYTLDKAIEITELREEQILELVELIHSGERVSFWWTMGVNQGYEAVRTAQAIINLALMTGNIGREGTGANSITGQCNAMGSRAYSNTACFFGGGDFNNPNRRKRIAEVLGVKDSDLAEKPTATYNQIIEGINEGKIKGLWILCTNPRHSWTNNETFAKAIEKLELFVVQDIYDDTDSANHCTVFFPAVSGIKKEGTYINLERRVSAMRPCLEKGENEKNDYEIIYGVGKALGMGSLLDKWKTPRDCFELMKECSRGMPCDITGITWEGLEGSNGIQWPFREGEELKEDERRLYEDGKFYTPSKKAKFIFEDAKENPLPTTEEFPYVLNTGRGTVGQWHTQTRTKEVQFIEDVSIKKSYIYMNSKLALENGIKENDFIRVYSINGEYADFFVKITDNLRYEQLYAPIHYIECNKLTPSLYDPYSKEPSYKATPIYFEKL